MGKTLTALKLVAGLLLYILDVGSDIYVAVRCHQEDKTSWCAITIAIVLVASTVIVNVVAFFTRKRELGICIYGVAFLGQLCVIVRYVEQLVCLKKGNSVDKDSNRKLPQVRCTRALFQSGPQCFIQTYIMLDFWFFPWYIIASTIVSFVSLLWGFTSVPISDVELSEDHANVDENNRPLRVVIVFFFSQLGFLVSRISLLVIFTYAFRFYLALLSSIRLTIFTISAEMYIFYILSCYICISYGCCKCSDIEEFANKVWVVIKIILMSFFDLTICRGKFKKMCILHFLEYGIMFSLVMWCPPVISIHMELLRYFALRLVLGGSGAGILFFGIYYTCCQCKSEDSTETQIQENDSVPHSPPQSVVFFIHKNLTDVSGTREENMINALYIEP